MFKGSQRRCIHNTILSLKIGSFSVLITRQIGANTSVSPREYRLCIIGEFKVNTAKHYTFKLAATPAIGQWHWRTLFAHARVLFHVYKIDLTSLSSWLNYAK